MRSLEWPAAPPSRWPGFVASAGLHLAILLALPALTERSPSKLALARSERILRTIRIRIPEQLYLAASGPAVRRARPIVFKAAPRGGEASRAAAPKPRSGPRRRFELPPVPRQAETDQSLLQPRHDLAAAPGLRLPELFFWAPPPPHPAVRPFVQPGLLHPPTQPARLDAPPRLDVPGFDLAAMESPVSPGAGALTLPPPPSLPIRTSVSEAAAPSGGAADRIAGDPANVLALSASSMPLREFVSVPPGTQVGRTPGAVAGGTLAGAAEEGTPGPGAAPPLDPALPPGPVPPAPAAGTSAAPRSPPPRTETPAGTSVLAIEATRKEFPTTGVFDVVVQSAGAESLQESAGVLSGKPVYSVYLQVGGSKDWILQYCVPAADVPAPASSGSVVRLGGPGRLGAPYPLVTYRPPIGHYGSRYLMLHGFVSADGRFQELRALGAHDPSVASLAIAVLARWEFRPATQDGKAVRVEILIGIPGA